MRNLFYQKRYQALLTPEIVALLGQLHERKAEQNLLVGAKADTLVHLVEIAKIQSTEASNRIEGIYTSDERLKKLVLDKTRPATRGEQEIAGYRDVLNTIHTNYEYIPPKPSYILQLHRDLYKFNGLAAGGAYKNVDNVIEETDAQGTRRVRFQPVPAWETPEAMERLCAAFDEAVKDSAYDPLLLVPMFILDFLCIHPFNDGNGRMSRLLTLLLLCRAGYAVGKYVSIEKMIEATKENYYDALERSSVDWHEGCNDDVPFVQYLLDIILASYREFSARLERLGAEGQSKPDQVRKVIRDTLGKITKAEIMAQCPNISQVTVQRTLNDLLKSGEILKISGGRYTAYTWNREND